MRGDVRDRSSRAWRAGPATATALALATELWAAGHGVATLELSALLTPEQAIGVAEALRAKLLAGS